MGKCLIYNMENTYNVFPLHTQVVREKKEDLLMTQQQLSFWLKINQHDSLFMVLGEYILKPCDRTLQSQK